MALARSDTGFPIYVDFPNLDTRSVGTVPKQSAKWLDGVTCIDKRFTEWPNAGERHVIDGQL